MKHIISIITITAIAVIAMLTFSCSLDYYPIGSYYSTEGVTSDSTQNGLKDRAAVLSQYTIIHDYLRNNGQEPWYLDILLLGEVHSDNAYAGTSGNETTPFEVNSIEGSNINLARDWNFYMGAVAQANKMICNIDQVTDPALSESERERYKSEALIFRAMIYFDMVRIWGNVPLITTQAGIITAETIVDVYPAYFPEQSSTLEVYKQIEKDLLEALPSAPDNNAGDKTVFSKSVARTILAKIYAEKTLRDYDKVLQYCDEVEADGFNLVEDFNDLWGVVLNDPNAAPGADNLAIEAKMRNTVESIYEAQYSVGSGNWCTWMFGRQMDSWNYWFEWAKWITPSRDMIKAFTDIGDMERFNESVVYYSCGWQNYYPSEHYPFMYKTRSSFNSIIKFRFADVLLLKAEALIKTGKFGEAKTIIDRIRNRANLAPTDASAFSNEDVAINTYLKERRLELAFEGSRWFDLVRLDKVEEVMNNINSKDEGRPALVYLFDNNSYLLPIPQAIIDDNPNLIQNPGY